MWNSLPFHLSPPENTLLACHSLTSPFLCVKSPFKYEPAQNPQESQNMLSTHAQYQFEVWWLAIIELSFGVCVCYSEAVVREYL